MEFKTKSRRLMKQGYSTVISLPHEWVKMQDLTKEERIAATITDDGRLILEKENATN